jgi:hypothetical protein
MLQIRHAVTARSMPHHQSTLLHHVAAPQHTAGDSPLGDKLRALPTRTAHATETAMMRSCLGLLAATTMLGAHAASPRQLQGLDDICAADISGPARGVPDGVVNVMDVRNRPPDTTPLRSWQPPVLRAAAFPRGASPDASPSPARSLSHSLVSPCEVAEPRTCCWPPRAVARAARVVRHEPGRSFLKHRRGRRMSV